MNDRVSLLIDILLDYSAREDERDDAAMALGLYDDNRALEALVKIASNPNSLDEGILDVCGESIGQILAKQTVYRKDIIDQLTSVAKDEALAIIKGKKPQWLD